MERVSDQYPERRAAEEFPVESLVWEKIPDTKDVELKGYRLHQVAVTHSDMHANPCLPLGGSCSLDNRTAFAWALHLGRQHGVEMCELNGPERRRHRN